MKRARKKFYFVTERTLRLTRAQTRLYEDRGPAGNDFRREVWRLARERARETGRAVTIASSDGITFEHLTPEEEW